ncbi:MAG: 50S ribosomal protein L13 [bacterium]|nr:50S ribosomal protein L13 [bacterium]MDT8366142.1 50S ribosomal protein L13 [bacterium]
MKTYSAKKEDIERQWVVIDAQDQVLGRLATRVATILRGKHKPIFTNHVDTGDFVIIVNAEKVRLTGNKLDAKVYYRHSGYPGGIKGMSAREMLDRKPEQVIKIAVKGMLPKNRLASRVITKLKVYAGPDHPHSAQQPEKIVI